MSPVENNYSRPAVASSIAYRNQTKTTTTKTAGVVVVIVNTSMVLTRCQALFYTLYTFNSFNLHYYPMK